DRLVLTLDDVPEADRFAYWRETVAEEMFGVTGERIAEQAAPFAARVTGSISASLTHFRYRSDGLPVFRRPRDIARHSWDGQIWLRRENGEGSSLKYPWQEFVTRPGDLFVADTNVPFTMETRRSYDADLWFFPRALIDPHLAPSRRPRSLLLAENNGINGLIKAYLDALAGQIDYLTDAEAGAVADNFCRLLAVACGSAMGDHREAIGAAKLEQAKRYIGLHLSDPELTPEKAAGALNMSVRQLQRLFEPSGTGFAQYLLLRRLQECRAALTSPIGADRSVTDIAFAWGFNSLATFYRTFRRSFGAAPNELRAAAPGRHGLRHDLAGAEKTQRQKSATT
ncbi:MAG: helix-turn-helix domain-containing protein, partial [Methylocella sp.]